MKLKSLLFGSAAILAAGTGARAADLPTAEPVEYVRICDAFGTGFFYIPGTDTCLQISGMVRADFTYVDFADDHNGAEREFNNYSSLARAEIKLDARTQTDFGLIRAYIRYRMTLGTNNFDTDYESTSPYLVNAFVQITNDWGTITAGRTSSFFDFFGSNTFGDRVFIDDLTNEVNTFAYTAAFGNGVSATLSIEDAGSDNRRLNTTFLTVDPVTGDPGLDNYEGQEWPDVVANIRIDQGWGSAQIMGVLHGIHDKHGIDCVGSVDPNGNPICINTEGDEDADGLGWAVGGGASFHLPFLNNSGLAFQATYGDGAIGYVTLDPGGVGDFTGPSGDDTNTAWSIRAGLTLGWTPTLTSYIDVSYTNVDLHGNNDHDTTHNFGDYDMFAVVGNLVWTPVKGLSMGPEIGWQQGPQFDHAGDANNNDRYGVMFRMQRDF
jgi:hypothetical protein